MGASLSSFTPFSGTTNGNTSTTTTTTPASATTIDQTPKKRGPGRPRKNKKAPDNNNNNIIRQSRRAAKCKPSKVYFPTWPKTKTPSQKKYPLTPNTRAKVEAKTKPIIKQKPQHHRKSPRVKHKYNKHMIPKVAKGVSRFTPNATYEIDELVFAWDKDVLYEGKVMNWRSEGEGEEGGEEEEEASKEYRVHFIGYKKFHDKWITPNQMLKVDYTSRKYFKETRGKLPFD